MNPIIFSLTVFLAGILSFFSPCVFPLLPVYIGILLGSDQEKAIRLFGMASLRPCVLSQVFLLFSSSLVLERACLERSCTPIGSVI